MKKMIINLLLISMSAMILTGCGGDSAPEASAPSTEVAEEQTEKVETTEEKEIVEGTGIQTVEGKTEVVEFVITYDGDVLHLENGEYFPESGTGRFSLLEDGSELWVKIDEKIFSGDNSLNRIYTDEIENVEELHRKITYKDGTVEEYSYTDVQFTELTDKTIDNIAGKYCEAAVTDSRGDSFTRQYFMFEYDEHHYTLIYYDATAEEQLANFEKLVEAVTLEITCEGMLPGNANGIVNAGEEKSVKKVPLLYNNGASTLEISFNENTVYIDEYLISEPQQELEVIYHTNSGEYRYVFYTDNENYSSVDDFYQINVNDCKKMFSDAVATELKEISCGNITFYEFTMTYTDNSNNAVTAPLYFAEIEPGVYIYTNLGDTMQFGDVNTEKLSADEEMLKETFLNVEIL